MAGTKQARVALVTGAAGGIGSCLCNRLLGAGYRVAASDLSLAALQAKHPNAAPDSLLLLEQDVRDPEIWTKTIDRVIERFGTLDVLLNVAGYLQGESLYDADPRTTHTHIDVNVKGLIFGTQAAAKVMVARKSGHIVNIASVAGIGPVPGMAVYAASKYAVRGFSLSAAVELRPFGVMVTAVCPDSVDTDMLARQRTVDQSALMFSGKRPLQAKELVDAIVRRVLVKRPFELRIPRGRCRLARLADTFPALVEYIAPSLWKKGRAKQQAILAGK